MPTFYQNKPALSFDDVLMVPQKSDIESRSQPSLRTRLSRNVELAHPVVATNMSTITEYEMMLALWRTGSFAILHRFMDTPAFMEQMSKFINEADLLNEDIPLQAVISVGVKGEEINNGWLNLPCIAAVVVDVAQIGRAHV